MSLSVRYFGYAGLLLLGIAAALLALFGLSALRGLVALQFGLLGVAGLCCVAGGFATPIRERVGALRLVGVADVSLGASMAVSALTVTDVLVLRAVFVLGGLCMVLIGANYLADGRFFELGGVEA